MERERRMRAVEGGEGEEDEGSGGWRGEEDEGSGGWRGRGR